MEERKKRFAEADVLEEIRAALNRVMGNTSLGLHVFVPAADIPDEWSLRLVVLPPEAAWSRTGQNAARDAAAAILRMRGDQPRQKQNRLLFLAADADQVRHLKDTVRGLLAWRNIENDARELRMTLDNLQLRQVTQYKEQTHQALLRLTRDTFKWLVAPSQGFKRDGSPGDIDWEPYALNPATPGLGKEIDRVCKENELVIDQWAPVHLHSLLKRWFWKDGTRDVPASEVWQKTCQYLYLPRLANSNVMRDTISEGAASREYFGIATAKEGEAYRGFSYGGTAAIYMDALLLIEPDAAAEYAKRTQSAESSSATSPAGATVAANDVPDTETGASTSGGATAGAKRPKRYFGTVELDPVRASLEFSKIQNELIGLFTSDAATRVRIRVDIEAENPQGFDETTVRAGKENGTALDMTTSRFE
jgi:hypothetical protein